MVTKIKTQGTIFDPRNDYNLRLLEKQSLIEPEPQTSNHNFKVTVFFDLEYDLTGFDIAELKEIAIENALMDIRRRKAKPSATVVIEVDKDGEVID